MCSVKDGLRTCPSDLNDLDSFNSTTMTASQTWITLCTAVTFSTVATALWILASCTDWWEHGTYSVTKLRSLYKDTSSIVYTVIAEKDNGLIRIIANKANVNSTEYVIDHHSGIWEMCSYLNDSDRKWLNDSGVMDWYAKYPCFIYAHHYKIHKIYSALSEEARWLVRMQNSATSCVIVVILLALSSAVLAPVAVFKKQVAICMVTAVMYGVAAVFSAFGICIIHAKIDYMNTANKYTIGQRPSETAFQARTVTIGFSVIVGWVSGACFFLCFCIWMCVCRKLRHERAHFMP